MKVCLRVSFTLLSILLGNITYLCLSTPVSRVINYNAKQIEITNGGNLLNSQGQLIERGYARQPIKDMNQEDIIPFLGSKQLSFLRYKKWDFFDVISPSFQLHLHFADLGYAGNIQISVYLPNEQDVLSFTETIHDTSKLPVLHPDSPRYHGSYQYQSDLVQLSITQLANYSSTQHRIECALFSGEAVLTKSIGEDELVMLTPINQDGSHFYYNTKTYGLQANGQITINNSKVKPIIFNSSSLGGRDIGRGVWNYNSYWFWAHGQGFINDDKGNPVVPFGIDLGNGFEDESTQTYEDCLIIGGKLLKLGVVVRNFKDGKESNVWTLKTYKQGIVGSLKATFNPILGGIRNENFIVIQASLNKYYGTFEGTFIDENGKEISFSNIQGFAELHTAKW